MGTEKNTSAIVLQNLLSVVEAYSFTCCIVSTVRMLVYNERPFEFGSTFMSVSTLMRFLYPIVLLLVVIIQKSNLLYKYNGYESMSIIEILVHNIKGDIIYERGCFRTAFSKNSRL